MYSLAPLKVTFVTVERFSPSMVTEVGGLVVPSVGEKPVITAPLPVRKLLLVVKLPLAVVTSMGPVVAPVGTVALIWVVEVIVALADLPPISTVVGLKKFPPLMTTVEPMAPAVGEKLVMVGTLLALNMLVLTADPASVVTVIGPLPAPAGTVALTSVVAVTVPLVGAAPLKVTVVPPVMKLAPRIETAVPADPVCGEKLAMVGATVKLEPLVAVPLLVPTLK